MYSLIRRILFLFDAELIHEFSVKAIKILNLLPFSKQILRYFFLTNSKVLETPPVSISVMVSPLAGVLVAFIKTDALLNVASLCSPTDEDWFIKM